MKCKKILNESFYIIKCIHEDINFFENNQNMYYLDIIIFDRIWYSYTGDMNEEKTSTIYEINYSPFYS